MGQNDPPLDVALIEKQLAFLAKLGLVEDIVLPQPNVHTTALRENHSSKKPHERRPPKKIEQAQEGHHGVVLAKAHNGARIAFPRDTNDPDIGLPKRIPTCRHTFRQWRQFTFAAQATTTAVHAYQGRLLQRTFHRWHQCFSTARENNLRCVEMEAWRMQRRLRDWHLWQSRQSRLRRWHDSHSLLLHARSIVHGVLVAWHRCARKRSARHRGTFLLTSMGRSFINRRIFTLLARHALAQTHRRRHIVAPTFHKWSIVVKRRADRRLYTAECEASMAQRHRAVAVAKWTEHVKRRRKRAQWTLVAELHVQRVWFQRWCRSHHHDRATSHLVHVQNQILLARIVTHWTRHRRLVHVIAAAQKHLYAQLVKALVLGWKQRTEVQLGRVAVAVALEDWRVQRHLAQWRAQAMAWHHRRTLHAKAVSFYNNNLVQDAIRRLEAAAHTQCVYMRRAVEFCSLHVRRRSFAALRRAIESRVARRALACRALAMHHTNLWRMHWNRWTEYVHHQRRRNEWTARAENFMVERRLRLGVHWLWLHRQQDKEARATLRRALAWSHRHIVQMRWRKWTAVVRVTVAQRRGVHSFWTNHRRMTVLRLGFDRWTQFRLCVRAEGKADTHARRVRLRRLWRHWCNLIAVTHAVRRMVSRRWHRNVRRTFKWWQARTRGRELKLVQSALAWEVSTRQTQTRHFRTWRHYVDYRRSLMHHGAAVAAKYVHQLAERAYAIWRLRFVQHQLAKQHHAAALSRRMVILVASWRSKVVAKKNLAMTLASRHCRRDRGLLAVVLAQWRRRTRQIRQKVLATWIGRQVVCRPVWQKWLGAHKLHQLLRRWAAYAQHCRLNLRVSGHQVRRFREGQAGKRQIRAFQTWCLHVDAIAVWRHEYMAAKRQCLVDVVAAVRKRRLADMYSLYRHFHAFCKRATTAQRTADWFWFHRTGRRCLKAWWRVVLVRKQTQLLRATQAMTQAHRQQGGAKSYATTPSYAGRQREMKDLSSKLLHPTKQHHQLKQTSRSPPKVPGCPPPDSPVVVTSAHTRAGSGHAQPRSPPRTRQSAPAPPRRIPKSSEIKKPKVRPPDATTTATTSKAPPQTSNTPANLSPPTFQDHRIEFPPQVAAPNNPVDLVSPPTSPMATTCEARSALDSPVSPNATNRPTEAFGEGHGDPTDLADLLEPEDLPTSYGYEPPNQQKTSFERFTEDTFTLAECAPDQLVDASSAPPQAFDAILDESVEQAERPSENQPFRDLLSLAGDDMWPGATPEASPVAWPTESSNAAPPAPVATTAAPPDVTWNKCILALFDQYKSLPPIPTLPLMSQVAVRLFDCVRMLGWMYNDFSFKESKRCLVQSQTCPSDAVDVAWLCRYLDLVAAHRASLEVDVFTKAQLSRFAHVDAGYAAMPALAPCCHLKRLLFCKQPPALLDSFTTPPTMLCERVLTLVETHRKLFRALFVGPRLKQRTTTGAMLRHIVVSKDDFLAIAKGANIFPMFFTRRELLACFDQSSSVDEVLTFPEFIECLFRCSDRFFTVHQDGGDSAEADKFQALVMAMDGHGSVLQKHSVTPVESAAPSPRLGHDRATGQHAKPRSQGRPKLAPYVHQPSPLDAVYRPPPRVQVPIMEKALRNAQLKFLRGKYPST